MKIIITSTGDKFDDLLDEEFGHCAYFILYDTETETFKAIPNEGHTVEMGAGIYAAELAVKLGAEVVITGWMGPHGQKKLLANNIRIIMDEEGTIREAVERYRKKHLNKP